MIGRKRLGAGILNGVIREGLSAKGPLPPKAVKEWRDRWPPGAGKRGLLSHRSKFTAGKASAAEETQTGQVVTQEAKENDKVTL